MNVLDLPTVGVLTAIVVTVAAVLFLVETIIRRDDGAGRLWALGYVAAMLTSICYLIWVFIPGELWPIALGNAMFVAGTGAMWLGARRFNQRAVWWAGPAVAVGAAGAFVAVVLSGPSAGDWAGALWMFIALLLFAAAGAVECFRWPMRGLRTAWALGIILGLQSAFYVGRTIVFVDAGPDSALFVSWFGPEATGVFTIVLITIAVVVTSVLRAGRAELRGSPGEAPVLGNGIFAAQDARTLLDHVCRTGGQRGEVLMVVSIRIDDLGQISSAFGAEAATETVNTLRASVRRGAPTFAVVGEDDRSGLLIVANVSSVDAARQSAVRMQRTVLDAFGSADAPVIPVLGVGVAVSSLSGYEPETLTRAARDSAIRAAMVVRTPVVVHGA